MAKLNFDASKVAPQKPMEPVPTNWYPMVIEASDVQPTKDTKGSRLELTLRIVDGEFRGRKAWEGLNLKNASKAAEEIAHAQLSAICHAVNVIQLKDSKELHEKPFMGRLFLRGAEGQYEAKNELKAVKPFEGTAPSDLGTPTGGKGTSGAAGDNTPPWLKGGGGAAPAGGGAPAGDTPAGGKKGPPAAPGGKKGPPPPTAKKDDRMFYCHSGGVTSEDTQSADTVQAMVNAGTADLMLCADGDEGWKTPAEYGFTPAAPAGGAGGKNLPPWERK